jgi:hypothetical protein
MNSTKTHDDKVTEPVINAPVLLADLDDPAAILAMDDITEEWVDVPEWGVRARVVSLAGFERDAFELALIESKKGKSREVNLENLRAKLVAQSVRKPSDRAVRVFADAQVVALGRKNAAALQRIFKVAQRLSGLADDEVEELTAELGEGQSVVSGSA